VLTSLLHTTWRYFLKTFGNVAINEYIAYIPVKDNTVHSIYISGTGETFNRVTYFIMQTFISNKAS